MAAAKVRHAILTSLSHSIFLIKDTIHSNVVYISSVLPSDRTPVILYYSAFLAMAAGPELLEDFTPKIPEIDEELVKGQDRILEECYRGGLYGMLF